MALAFEAPGPGVWSTDPAHTRSPFCRWMADVYPPAFAEGWAATAAHYGLGIVTMEMRTVHGMPYVCPRPVGAPESATAPPPWPVLWLLSRLHPAIRSRNRRAVEVWRDRVWRDDVARWDTEWKPAVTRDLAALDAVDPEALDDEALVEHLEACRAQVVRTTVLHHRLNGCWLLPLGDFVAQVAAWTGCSHAAILDLCGGSSAVSVGATDELDTLGEALAGAPEVLAALDGPGAAADRLQALLGRDDAPGRAAQAWVRAVGHRTIGGYDVALPRLVDVPEALLRCATASVAGKHRPAVHDRGRRVEAIRARVPSAHREAFDALLQEARLTYRVRDERCYLSDAWAYGITHGAIREAGRRLVVRQRLHAAEHAFDLTPAEIADALRGRSGPDRDQVAGWAEQRRTLTVDEAPRYLGGRAAPPPPGSAFPAGLRRIADALTAVLPALLDDAPQGRSEGTTVHGLGAHPGTAEGTARHVLDPDQLGRVQAGDVLVAPLTTPAYNAILPLLAGIVTDRGGLLSHAAIVAREFGIPSVVGCRAATTSIPDGAAITVDGGAGRVTVHA